MLKIIRDRSDLDAEINWRTSAQIGLLIASFMSLIDGFYYKKISDEIASNYYLSVGIGLFGLYILGTLILKKRLLNKYSIELLSKKKVKKNK